MVAVVSVVGCCLGCWRSEGNVCPVKKREYFLLLNLVSSSCRRQQRVFGCQSYFLLLLPVPVSQFVCEGRVRALRVDSVVLSRRDSLTLQ